MKLKDRLNALDDRVKVFLLHAYVAGVVFLIAAIGLGLGFFEIGIFLGIVNSFITDPLIANIRLGNKAEDVKVIARFRIAKNLLLSILVCYFIAWLRFTISVHVLQVYLEPISFGLLYGTIHLLIVKIFSQRKLLSKKRLI